MTQPSTAKQTLIGALIGLGLAALASLGIQLPGWLTGKTPTTPTPDPPPPGRPAQHGPKLRDHQRSGFMRRSMTIIPRPCYCGCDYVCAPGQPGAINLRSCGVAVRQDPARAQRLEAEHVFPAAQFGNFRPCWREPERFPDCVKDSGKALTGRQCCEKIDPVFEAAHNDLYNLFPAEGEINGDRKDYNWGMVPGAARDDGRCAMKIDARIRRVEPPDTVKGDIARAMFSMSATYGFKLSDQDRPLFTAWSRLDPPDA